MKYFVLFISLISYLITLNNRVYAADFFISPTGSDTNTGLDTAHPLATFNFALGKVNPGETLFLIDGIYKQSITPHKGGSAGNLISVKAINDGQAIIDGEYTRIPVWLNKDYGATYWDIEGIIAKNSSGAVYYVTANNNVFRRVSGYNANTDDNYHVFLIWANDNLVEDCIAAGSGRKMIMMFNTRPSTDPGAQGQRNIIRRCFASYREWDGKIWHDEWPWNENFEAYGGDYNIFENDIAYGNFMNAGFSLLSNGSSDDNVGNQVLGSMAIGGGMDFLGNPVHIGNIRPQPASIYYLKDIFNPAHRVGFFIGHVGIIQNNLLQDVLAWGNGGMGISTTLESGSMTGNQLNRATFVNNGLDFVGGTTDMFTDTPPLLSITNSRIASIKGTAWNHPSSTPITGEGARLQNRYVKGVLTSEPLWPWPMEDRVRNEMGISVTNLASQVTQAAGIGTPVSAITDTNRPFLALSPLVLAFGNTKLGTVVNKPLTLKNTGTAPVTITGYQFLHGSNQFTIASGGTCTATPYSLSPNQSCSLNLSFTTQTYVPQTADFQVLSTMAPYPGPAETLLSAIGYGTVNNNPISIPGTLEAVAYNNSSGTFIVKPSRENGGSAKISDVSSGAWTEYPLTVSQTGTYQVSAHFASTIGSTRTLTLQIDSATPIPIAITGTTSDWDTYTDIPSQSLTLSSGSHKLRLTFTTGDYDLRYLSFLPVLKSGDFNSDGVVDSRDFLAFIPQFSQSNATFKLLGSGFVNLFDYNKLINLMFK